MKIFNVICNVSLIIVVILALLLIISVIPVPGNFKVLTVLSGSMEPAIKTGSVVFVKPAHSTGSGQADYKIGDIITFGDQEGSKVLTTHRIVKTEYEDEKTLYTVKGDANKAADIRKVPSENVVGKTLFSIPFLGYLLNFAKQPIGCILRIWVPAIIIIWEEIEKIRKELKKKSEKPKVKPESKVKVEAQTQVRKQTQIRNIKVSKTGSNIGPKIIILRTKELKSENQIEKTRMKIRSEKTTKSSKIVRSKKIIRGRKATESKKVKRTKTGKENKK